MNQSPAAPTVPASGTFAGMLAALSAPVQKPAAGWNDEDLAEDVATLSYEKALWAHARYRAPELSDESLAQPVAGAGSRNVAAERDACRTTAGVGVDPGIEAGAEDRNLKCASITIRMSKAECEQLRKRAAEAGLTVSAYLRSCTFEAEQLRALVKDTLVQLRNEPGHTGNAECAEESRGWRQRLGRFWPHARVQRPIAQA